MDHIESGSSGETPRLYLDPRLNNHNQIQAEPISIAKFDNSNQEFIDKWLLEKGKFQMQFIPKTSKNDVNISTAKKSLKQCLDIIKKLDETQEDLRTNVATMSSNEWKQKTMEIGNLRDDFNKYMLLFENKNTLLALSKVVKKRKKKRLNMKKSKSLLREENKSKQEETKAAHKNIDAWLERKKEEVERAKTEERMKKDADCVMYEVTKNKSEARKQLSLISALVKLRTVRDAFATQRGEKPSLEDRKAFGSVTEKLIRMWENAFQDYTKEETCLQVMLEHNATKDTQAARMAKEQRISNQWERVVFGPRCFEPTPMYWALMSAERDMETFIAIRKSWDTFVTPRTNPAGSSIPIGWIVPPQQPDDRWKNYLEM